MASRCDAKMQRHCCNFCHNRDPCDNVKYTHLVKDKTGKNACPFLDVNVCTMCFKQGHTAKFCNYHMEMMDMEMKCSMVLKDDSQADIDPYDMDAQKKRLNEEVKLLLDREALWLESMYYKQRKLHFERTRRFLQTGCYHDGDQPGSKEVLEELLNTVYCRFCYNHNPRDPIFTTHRPMCVNGINQCPRIRLWRCSKCRQHGHTPAHCPLNNNNMSSSPTQEDEEYIIDFGESDEDMV